MSGDRFITDRDLGDEDDLNVVFAIRRAGDVFIPGMGAAWKMLGARHDFRLSQRAEAKTPEWVQLA